MDKWPLGIVLSSLSAERVLDGIVPNKQVNRREKLSLTQNQSQSSARLTLILLDCF